MTAQADKPALICSGAARRTEEIVLEHETRDFVSILMLTEGAAGALTTGLSVFYSVSSLLILERVGDFVSLNFNKGFVCQSEEV